MKTPKLRSVLVLLSLALLTQYLAAHPDLSATNGDTTMHIAAVSRQGEGTEPVLTPMTTKRARPAEITTARSTSTPTKASSRATRTDPGGMLMTTATSSATTFTTSASGLPDLVILALQISLERGGACDYTSTALGLRVDVGNIGGSVAGPFVVEANGLRQTVTEGLAAGATTSLWFERYVYLGNNTVIVDATGLVEASNEANNQRSELVAIPTLPPTCTATPTPSMTPTATATPTSTGTARATEECRSEAGNPPPAQCYKIYVPLVQTQRSP